MTPKVSSAQKYIAGTTVARMAMEFTSEFRDTYPTSVLEQMLAVGPMQSFIGLAIKNGHIRLVDDDAVPEHMPVTHRLTQGARA